MVRFPFSWLNLMKQQKSSTETLKPLYLPHPHKEPATSTPSLLHPPGPGGGYSWARKVPGDGRGIFTFQDGFLGTCIASISNIVHMYFSKYLYLHKHFILELWDHGFVDVTGIVLGAEILRRYPAKGLTRKAGKSWKWGLDMEKSSTKEGFSGHV